MQLTTFTKRLFTSTLFTILLLTSCVATEPIELDSIGSLDPISEGQIIEHTYFKLAYSEDHEQPFWVFYQLTPKMVTGSVERTDDFRPDPKVSTGSASLNDYKGSGYDRGHLCPAADMKLNSTSMSESFYLSNMSPQNASFNRGIWSKLESLVRTWCINEDTIYIATGPIFKGNLGSIGENKVTIPGYYYKAILDFTNEMKAIALVLPNAGSQQPLTSFAISVDSLESLTGIDFFPGLPDYLETKVESSVDISKWVWESSSTVVEKSAKSSGLSESEKQGTATQCKGTAKSTGQRCKNQTTNANGYCHVHQNQSGENVKSESNNYTGQCCAQTKAGSRCKRQATGGSRYCWQHQ